jgi:hypothetical protein
MIFFEIVGWYWFFITIYDTKKLSYFVSIKDKLPLLSRTNIVYKVACPGCGETYIDTKMPFCTFESACN